MTDHDLLLQIVHKLDHMATKEDIVNFATKDDLRASIDEVKAEFNDKLANFATKDDLANFATKDDLKEAIEDAKSELYDEIVLCEKDIDEIKEQMSFFKAATSAIPQYRYMQRTACPEMSVSSLTGITSW